MWGYHEGDHRYTILGAYYIQFVPVKLSETLIGSVTVVIGDNLCNQLSVDDSLQSYNLFSFSLFMEDEEQPSALSIVLWTIQITAHTTL